MNRRWIRVTLVCSLLMEGCVDTHFSSRSEPTKKVMIHPAQPLAPDVVSTRDRIARAILLYAAADALLDQPSDTKSATTTIAALFLRMVAVNEVEECGFPREKAAKVLAGISLSLKTTHARVDTHRIIRGTSGRQRLFADNPPASSKATPTPTPRPRVRTDVTRGAGRVADGNDSVPSTSQRQRLFADNPPASSKATPTPMPRPRVRTDVTRGAGRVADHDPDEKVDSRLAALAVGAALLPLANLAGSPTDSRDGLLSEREEEMRIESEAGQMHGNMKARTEAEARARFFAFRTRERWQLLSPSDRQRRVELAYDRLDGLSTELNSQETNKIRAALDRLSEPSPQ